MAFNEIELMHIKRTVGKLCERRPPPRFRNELRTIYEIQGHDVTVYDERPRRLHWMRRDLKWHSYRNTPDVTTLEPLVDEVINDPLGAFWG